MPAPSLTNPVEFEGVAAIVSLALLGRVHAASDIPAIRITTGAEAASRDFFAFCIHTRPFDLAFVGSILGLSSAYNASTLAA